MLTQINHRPTLGKSTVRHWIKLTQECIPVGCVPSACYRTWGGLGPGGSLSRGVSVWGVFVRSVSVRGVSVRGSLSGGFLSIQVGSLSRGVFVWGVSVQGGLPDRDPPKWRPSRTETEIPMWTDRHLTCQLLFVPVSMQLLEKYFKMFCNKWNSAGWKKTQLQEKNRLLSLSAK